jgi:hypothetical protein
MRKGIVLEVDEDFITLLTPEGEFIQIKKEGNYQIGEEIEKIPTKRQRVKKTFFRFSSFKVALTSIAAICLLVFTMFSDSTSNKVYAYLSIDINPSIEVAVNSDLKVVEMKGYNQDGKILVTRLSDWKGKPFIDIAQKIIELSIKNGYLHEGDEILITTVKKETNRSSSKQLVQQLNKVKQSYEAKDIIVTTQTSTLKVRKEATEKGFTTGKYLRLQEKAKEKSVPNSEPLPEDGEAEQNEEPTGEIERIKETVPSQPNSYDPKENLSKQPPAHMEEKEEKFEKKLTPPSHRPKEKEDKHQEKREEKKEKKQEKREQKFKRKQEREEKKREEDDDKKDKHKDEDDEDDEDDD